MAVNLKSATEQFGSQISDLRKYRYISQHPAIPHLGIKCANRDEHEVGEQTEEVLLAAWTNICYITVPLTLLARDVFIV